MSDNADDGGAVRRSHKKYVQTLMASGRTTLSDWCQTMPRMAARSGVRRRGTGVGASAQAPVVQPKAHRPPLTPSSPARLPLPQLLTRLPRLPELPHPPPWNPPAPVIRMKEHMMQVDHLVCNFIFRVLRLC